MIAALKSWRDFIHPALAPDAYAGSPDSLEARSVLRNRLLLVYRHTAAKNRIVDLLARDAAAQRAFAGTDVFSGAVRRNLAKIELPGEARRLLDDQLELLEFLQDRMEANDHWLWQMAKDDERVRLLLTVPGIGLFFAVLIAHEAGDVNRFPSEREFCSYVGLGASVRGSGQSAHGKDECNKWLRYVMVEAVLRAIQIDVGLYTYYRGVLLSRDGNTAKMATGGCLAALVYRVLKEGKEYEIRCPLR